jgi:hypothetical protein
MTTPNESNSAPASQPLLHAPQTQGQRWIKYGSNVILSSLIVIALAVLVTWMAQARAQRIDTTIGSTQSLRPQTLSYIKELPQKIRLYGLYPKVKSDSHEQDFYQPVADLLNEYAAKGKNISAEMIDPDTQKDEFNNLVAEVSNRFGGDVKEYKSVISDSAATNAKLQKFSEDEFAAYRQLPADQVQDPQLKQNMVIAFPTLLQIPQELPKLQSVVDADMEQQVPSYKDAVQQIAQVYSNVEQILDLFSALLASVKNGAGVPKSIQDYIPGAEQRTSDTRKIVESMLQRIRKLPPLTELDEFRQELRSQSILVLTDDGYRIIQFSQAWILPQTLGYGQVSTDFKPRMTFAGEQRVTAALVTLTAPKKPMVVFMRAEGPLIATRTENMVGGRPPDFLAIAERLRDYNFDVREYDVSGQSNLVGQQPTLDELRSAVWIVTPFPPDQTEEVNRMSSMIVTHAKEGGSTLFLAFPTTAGMDDALAPWGINVPTAQVIVRDPLPAAQRHSIDRIDDALHTTQFAFKLSQYGDHPIATPLNGLNFVTLMTSPVDILPGAPADVAVTPLLPIEQNPRSWVASNAADILSTPDQRVYFNASADVGAGRPIGDQENTPAHPLFGAAAAEKSGGGRLVVVGSYWFASNEAIELQDVDMYEQHGLVVPLLPGNAEFFLNSIFWLAHMDSLLAISPQALQVARIADVPSLAFWRVGVLTAGLPAAVVVCGLIVYLRRRD